MAKKTVKITAEPGKQDMVIEREVDAPRELVFRAFTDKELYSQWIGPRGFTTDIEAFDVRTGGSYRYKQKDKEGKVYSFHGVYHDVSPPERIIDTFEYEGLPEAGHASLESMRFEELPGNRTRLVGKSVFLTVEDRDGMMQSGMEEGMEDSYSQLDELMERMKIKR